MPSQFLIVGYYWCYLRCFVANILMLKLWGKFVSVLFYSLFATLHGSIYGSRWRIDSLLQSFNVMFYKSTNPKNSQKSQKLCWWGFKFCSNSVNLTFWLFSDKDLKDCKYLAADYFQIRLSGVSVAGLRIQCRLQLSNTASGKGFQKTKMNIWKYIFNSKSEYVIQYMYVSMVNLWCLTIIYLGLTHFPSILLCLVSHTWVVTQYKNCNKRGHTVEQPNNPRQ